MAKKQADGAGSFIVGVLVGMVTGGLTSLWMSPRSGEQTRGELQRIVVTFRDQAQERVKDVIAKVPNPLGGGDDNIKPDDSLSSAEADETTA